MRTSLREPALKLLRKWEPQKPFMNNRLSCLRDQIETCRKFAFLSAAILVSQSASAQVLLGNAPFADDDLSSFISSTRAKAVSFVTPAGTPYQITGVDLRLQFYAATYASDPVVGFYADAGNNQPGSLVSLLSDAPLSSTDDVGTVTLTPIGTVTLAPNVKYWLVVGGEGAGDFEFNSSSTPVTPTGLATFGSFLNYNNANTAWEPTMVENSFVINATPVPEPSHYALAAGTGLLGFAIWRRKSVV